MHRSSLALLLLALPLTGCELFSKTTVPAQDDKIPWTGASLWYEGSHHELTVHLYDDPPDGFDIDVELLDDVTTDTDENTTYLLTGALIDMGGVAWIDSNLLTEVWCTVPGEQHHSGQLSETARAQINQAGQVGSVVDNGLAVYALFRPSWYESNCGDGFLVKLRFTLGYWGEDFAGNYQSGSSRATWILQ